MEDIDAQSTWKFSRKYAWVSPAKKDNSWSVMSSAISGIVLYNNSMCSPCHGSPRIKFYPVVSAGLLMTLLIDVLWEKSLIARRDKTTNGLKDWSRSWENCRHTTSGSMVQASSTIMSLIRKTGFISYTLQSVFLRPALSYLANFIRQMGFHTEFKQSFLGLIRTKKGIFTIVVHSQFLFPQRPTSN